MEKEILRPDVNVRFTEMDDAPYLRQWLLEPGVLRGFPMQDVQEVDDAVKHWISLSRYRCSLTAVIDGVPCGLTTLYLMPYRKLAHQCLFSIIVGTEYQGKGVGSVLLNNIMHLGKEQFRLEVLYLEYYEGNPAVHLYNKFGFKEVGRQNHFLKEDGKFVPKITMERLL
ncbi:MAG: GNAT family N-acetyltransferase [Parachlamydiales bacterium]|nr:GNAT family N-acetyltransferase [Parachlamydiales bacterium]